METELLKLIDMEADSIMMSSHENHILLSVVKIKQAAFHLAEAYRNSDIATQISAPTLPESAPEIRVQESVLPIKGRKQENGPGNRACPKCGAPPGDYCYQTATNGKILSPKRPKKGYHRQRSEAL